MDFDIRKMLEQGHAALREQHAEGEKAKLGQFRIGNAGVVAADGKIYGACHRTTLARLEGIDQPSELSTEIMWKAGEANEDTWARILTAGNPDIRLLRHDEVAVDSAITSIEPHVLGHPDIVIEQNGKVLGLELKGIYGTSTAVSVYYEHRPKPENLIQAAGYSYFRKIPYALCYTLPSWVALNFYDQKRYGTKHILPFYRIFYMEWRDDVLWYRDETQTDWVRTVITPQGIEDYYRLVVEMRQKKELGPRPTADYADGSKNKWDACGLCWAKSACAAYDDNPDFDEWLDRLRVLSQKGE